jgi:hypothetical protein
MTWWTIIMVAVAACGWALAKRSSHHWQTTLRAMVEGE